MQTAQFKVNSSFHNGNAIYIAGDTIEINLGEAVKLLRKFPDQFTPLNDRAHHAQGLATGEIEPDEDEADEIWLLGTSLLDDE